MIKAIVKDGVFAPVEPLPDSLEDGVEVEVVVPFQIEDDGDEPDEEAKAAFIAAAAEITDEEHNELIENLVVQKSEAKRLMAIRMGLVDDA